MASSYNFIPNSDSDKGIWMNNFKLKIAVHGSTLGLTAAEITNLQKDADMFLYVLNMHEAYKQTVNNISAYKNLLKHAIGQQHLGALPVAPVLPTAPAIVAEGVFDRISNVVKRAKAHANYTDAIGNDLGIIAATQTIDVNAMQPDLKITIDAGRPHIKCSKGYADAIDLYVDRNDGAGFVLIGRLLKLDYIDVVSLPANMALAEWHYKAMYVIGNGNVGLMSPVVSVVVKKL